MNRNCQKCIHHISGNCDAWGCEMQTLEDYRNKVIDEFAERIQWEYLNGCGLKQREIEFLINVSSMVAEQMKAGATNENSIIDEFANTLKGRLTDAIHQKDVESMTNLINDVAREVKAGGKNE